MPTVTAAPVLIPAAAAPAPITPAQHHHFLSLGQIIGLALLGLTAYHAQDIAPGGPATLLNPAVAEPYLAGILSLFGAPPTE
jgi:hypothetical protein